MKKYITTVNKSIVHYFDIMVTWNALIEASKRIASISNPSQVHVISTQMIFCRIIEHFSSCIGAT